MGVRMITGKYSHKLYKCRTCGHEQMIGTNHWGECYSWGYVNACPSCHWKHSYEPTVWECQEQPPEGYSKPEPWKMVRLGDLLAEQKRR